MENIKQDIETIHKDIILNLQHEISLRKKIFNFQKQYPLMLSTLNNVQSEKKLLEKALSKVEVALYIKI